MSSEAAGGSICATQLNVCEFHCNVAGVNFSPLNLLGVLVSHRVDKMSPPHQ